jgi:thiamine monophosphate synthase
MLVGLSVHDLAEIAGVTDGGRVDYLVFGTVFPSASKPGRTPAGLDALARAVAATPIPVLAIGGMASARLPEVGATGAAGFAAISLFADVPIDTLAVVVAGARQAFSRQRGVG